MYTVNDKEWKTLITTKKSKRVLLIGPGDYKLWENEKRYIAKMNYMDTSKERKIPFPSKQNIPHREKPDC